MSMPHHGDDPYQSELLKMFQQQQNGTSQRKWPDGRLSGDDDGSIAFKVGGDPDKNLVVVDFGKPVTWTAMSPADAVQFAQMLIRAARAVSTEPIRIVLN